MPKVLLYGNPGINKIDPRKMFGGDLYSAGTKVINVKTNNKSFTNETAHEGMMNLEAAMLANPGTPAEPTDIVGHSQFTSFMLKYLRERAPINGIDHSKYRMFMSGCPENKFGGATTIFPNDDMCQYPGDPAKGGTPHTAGCPTPPEFHGGHGIGYGIPNVVPSNLLIWFVINEFDGWADVPTNYLAVPELYDEDSIFGIVLRHPWFRPGRLLCKLRQEPHGADPAYYNGTLWGDENVTYTDPVQTNVKYMWRPYYPIPYAEKVKHIRFWARSIDLKKRPQWALAWNRPVSIPDPDYDTLPSLIPFD